MKKTSEQSYSEVSETKEVPNPHHKNTWIVYAATLKDLAEEMKKLDGSKGNLNPILIYNGGRR